MKKKLMVLSGFVLGLAPVAAFAQNVVTTGTTTNSCSSTVTTIGGVFCKISQILGAIVPVLIALAVVYFVWGVVQYVMSGDEEAKKAGRDRIIFGIIGLAVIIAMWGLVNILVTTFGLNGSNNTNVVLPTVPYNSNLQ
jgi:mannose/fructose/N-acetylgalactosamine-specific phosphotransferase system component IID